MEETEQDHRVPTHEMDEVVGETQRSEYFTSTDHMTEVDEETFADIPPIQNVPGNDGDDEEDLEDLPYVVRIAKMKRQKVKEPMRKMSLAAKKQRDRFLQKLRNDSNITPAPVPTHSGDTNEENRKCYVYRGHRDCKDEDLPLSLRLFVKNAKLTESGRPKRSVIEKREEEALRDAEVISKEIKRTRGKAKPKPGEIRPPRKKRPIIVYIMKIIRQEKDRYGSSYFKIRRILRDRYKVDVERNKGFIKRSLLKATEAGILFKSNTRVGPGIGVIGKFRLCTKVPVHFPAGNWTKRRQPKKNPIIPYPQEVEVSEDELEINADADVPGTSTASARATEMTQPQNAKSTRTLELKKSAATARKQNTEKRNGQVNAKTIKGKKRGTPAKELVDRVRTEKFVKRFQNHWYSQSIRLLKTAERGEEDFRAELSLPDNTLVVESSESSEPEPEPVPSTSKGRRKYTKKAKKHIVEDNEEEEDFRTEFSLPDNAVIVESSESSEPEPEPKPPVPSTSKGKRKYTKKAKKQMIVDESEDEEDFRTAFSLPEGTICDE